MVSQNILYYGDNLDVLRRHIKDESVDLIYLDPPFNSNRSYNVLFKDESGSSSDAQITAFDDAWHWGETAERTYQDLIQNAPMNVATMIDAMRQFIGRNQMMAYLVMMAARLVELHRVLKPTGSLYLHCDPTASHYLKMILDTIFDIRNFRSEIIWRRTGSHNKSNRYAPIHDVILFYSKTETFTWTYPKRPYMKGHVEEYFVKDEFGYKTNYYGNVLTGSGTRSGESGMPWKGFDPTAKDRHWAIPGALLDEINEDLSQLGQHEKLDRLFELGYIKIIPGQAWPIYEHRIQSNDGQPISDIFSYQPYTNGTVFNTSMGIDEDVRWLSPKDQERLGYPTQKPTGLLLRLLEASSNPGDVVLDPFSGCGTCIVAAQKLGRQWIGIDITHLAIAMHKNRLKGNFGLEPNRDYQVIGEPEDLAGAQQLARDDRYQFQWWALSLIKARPLVGTESSRDGKKGADRGIDGAINFLDDRKGGLKRAIVQVKSGHVNSGQIRDLKGTLEREKAAMGIFITLEPPTREMITEAASAGFYHSEIWDQDLPRIQILSIEELLNGVEVKVLPTPDSATAFKKAEKVDKEGPKQGSLL